MNHDENIFNVGLGGYKILQATNMTSEQMMSYFVITPNSKLIVIDGGNKGDANYLKEMIHKLGSKVDLWIITHMHYDHFNALAEILKQDDMDQIKIKNIVYNYPPIDWVLEAEPLDAMHNRTFHKLLSRLENVTTVAKEDDVYEVDGLKIWIMSVPDDYNEYDVEDKDSNAINNTSIAFKLLFSNDKTALFLGDFGAEAGHKLAHKYNKRLKSDIVQMAHHGQNGADKDVYEHIKPEICMWPTPIWLYDNNIGLLDPRQENKFNNYIWKTVTVRRWMKELGVEKHVIGGEGPAWII